MESLYRFLKQYFGINMLRLCNDVGDIGINGRPVLMYSCGKHWHKWQACPHVISLEWGPVILTIPDSHAKRQEVLVLMMIRVCVGVCVCV